MSLAARRYTVLSGVWRYAVGGLGRLRLRAGTADYGAHAYTDGRWDIASMEGDRSLIRALALLTVIGFTSN